MTYLLYCKCRPCVACGRDDGTIVPAHSNQQAHGKGMAQKAGDWTCVPLCRMCHALMDQEMPRDKARLFWRDCWLVHMSALCAAGLVAPVGTKHREPKPAPTPKIIKHTGVM